MKGMEGYKGVEKTISRRGFIVGTAAVVATTLGLGGCGEGKEGVENNDPVINEIAGKTEILENETLRLTADVTDVETKEDKLSYFWMIIDSENNPLHESTDQTLEFDGLENAGNYSVVLIVEDENGGKASDSVTIRVNEAPEEENEAPEANNDSAEVTEGESVIIDVLSNDSDLNGDTLTIQSVGTPEYGIAEIQDGKIKYTAENGYTGTVNFEYTITDGIDTATATVSINVIEAKEMSFSGPENGDDGSDYEITLDLEGYDINDLTFKVRGSYDENGDGQDYEEDIVLGGEAIGGNVTLDNNGIFTIKTTNTGYGDHSSMGSSDWVEVEAKAPDGKTITHKFTVN